MDREARTIEVIISLFWRNHHAEDLCPECAELIKYALERLQSCPFQDRKTVCAKCPVHCYQPVMRKEIKSVMRYAGPPHDVPVPGFNPLSFHGQTENRTGKIRIILKKYTPDRNGPARGTAKCVLLSLK